MANWISVCVAWGGSDPEAESGSQAQDQHAPKRPRSREAKELCRQSPACQFRVLTGNLPTGMQSWAPAGQMDPSSIHHPPDYLFCAL